MRSGQLGSLTDAPPALGPGTEGSAGLVGKRTTVPWAMVDVQTLRFQGEPEGALRVPACGEQIKSGLFIYKAHLKAIFGRAKVLYM